MNEYYLVILQLCKMERLPKHFTVLFNAFCFIILGYTIELQVERYFKNEDVSTISFKSFEGNEYPSYTICLEDNFNGDLLKYNKFRWDEIHVNGNNELVKKAQAVKQLVNPRNGGRIQLYTKFIRGRLKILMGMELEI